MKFSYSLLVSIAGGSVRRLSRLSSLRTWFQRHAPDRPECAWLNTFFRDLDYRLASPAIMENASPDEAVLEIDLFWEQLRPWLSLSVEDRFKRLSLTPPPKPGGQLYLAMAHLLRRHGWMSQGRTARWRMTADIWEHRSFPWVHHTLSVNPASYGKVFTTGSRSFRDYITSLRALVASAFFPDAPRRKVLGLARAAGLWLVRYCAVLEKGPARGRRHLHALICLQTLPPSFRDPNAFHVRRDRHELKPMEALWPYGFSWAKPLRIGPQDGFARAGWKWPNRLGSGPGSPCPCCPPLAIASYLAKYLTEDYHEPASDSLYRFRTRYSRGFGMYHIRCWLSRLSHSDTVSFCEAADSSLTYAVLQASVPVPGLRLPSRSFFRYHFGRHLFSEVLGSAHPFHVFRFAESCLNPRPSLRFILKLLRKTSVPPPLSRAFTPQNRHGPSGPTVSKLLPPICSRIHIRPSLMHSWTKRVLKSSQVRFGDVETMFPKLCDDSSAPSVSIQDFCIWWSETLSALVGASFCHGPLAGVLHRVAAVTDKAAFADYATVTPASPLLPFARPSSIP